MIIDDLRRRSYEGRQLSFSSDEKIFYWKPIFLILMEGRLGNLMFEYALLLRLRSEYPEYRGYLYRNKWLSDKTGYPSDLMDSFKIPSSDFASDELIDYVSTLPAPCVRCVREKGFAYRHPVFLKDALATIFIGYWQSEYFFEDVKPLIRDAFRFNLDSLNISTKQLSKKIRSECAIGVHIRRGDYIESHNIAMFGHICTFDYYKQALKMIIDKIVGEYFIYIFTDDPKWMKVNNPYQNSLVVDCNQGDEFWQDMYLMTQCRHNVIANSTFSWWGAWLNPHEEKIVVAPYRCFNTLWAPNIYPSEWKTIFPKDYIENNLVKLVEKNEITIDRNGLLYGKMGVAVFLFHFSQINNDPFCELIAMNLVDQVFTLLTKNSSFDYADGLTGIGVAIEYLIQNELVAGDSNDILIDIDIVFDKLIDQSKLHIRLQDGLLGLIRYYRFRYMGQVQDNQNGSRIKFAMKLECLLNMLYLEQEYFSLYKEDIAIELYELYLLNISSDQIKSMLVFVYSDFSDSFLEIVKHVSDVGEKKVNRITFGNSPGLSGLAGKELKTLSPISKISWIKLL